MSAADAWLIAEWQAAMRVDGWTRSAAERGAKTLRRLARVSGGGLLGCTQLDVLHFAADKARGLPAEDLMASASWHRALRTLDAFYGWAAGRFLLPVGSPLAGLRRVPRAGARAEAKTTGAWRRYDQVLNDPGANPRARAVLAVLALGLTVGEVMRLRSDDVDLERGELRVGGRGARRRLIPLGPRTVERLARWVTQRQAEVQAHGWLFTGQHGSQITANTVGDIVRRAARRVFRRPQQLEIRRRIRPGGFRHVFAARLLRRVRIDVAAALLGIGEIRLRAYRIPPPEQERVLREFASVRRRFPRWI